MYGYVTHISESVQNFFMMGRLDMNIAYIIIQGKLYFSFEKMSRALCFGINKRHLDLWFQLSIKLFT